MIKNLLHVVTYFLDKKLVWKPTRSGIDALEKQIRNIIKEKTNKTRQCNSGTPQRSLARVPVFLQVA